MKNNILWLDQLSLKDIAQVGGKNASLGEMLQNLTKQGILVPGGFATTAQAYRDFLNQTNLAEKIYTALEKLDHDDVNQLKKTASQIREWILSANFSKEFEQSIRDAFAKLNHDNKKTFAVRSSATAEDLPNASFAGQQETYLNISGIENVLYAVKKVYASLFNDRAITYRKHHGFAHDDVAISAAIQQMVRSDLASSGVIFSIDTESGFKGVVFITASYGLGEMIVQGAINPDEFYVSKQALQRKNNDAILMRKRGSKLQKMIYGDEKQPVKTIDTTRSEQQQFCLTATDIIRLAEIAIQIEKHYGRPMDIEWAKDGIDQQIYIVQARPETVKSNQANTITERYRLKQTGKVLTQGRSVGHKIGSGRACVLKDPSEIHIFQKNNVLVADMTDPDWEPIMKHAAAIVTNRGGRTCHAAIIARELGIPAVVGCGDATKMIKHGDAVTVSCAEGDDGFIYAGELPFEIQKLEIDAMPEISVKIMMNVGNPERAFSFAQLPHRGVGLARLEFIISQMIGIHPKACLEFEKLTPELQEKILMKARAYTDPKEYYIERLKEGIAAIAAAFYPEPVIVRLSDFKSNEYANLLGGNLYEPHEENPMLGFRGASRYIADSFRDCFELECQAVKRVRNDMGFKNVEVMIPFVRTVQEIIAVNELLKQNNLERGKDALRVIMMCELPSNALCADEFLQHVDGFSIGSNDLTQLTLGLDRDSNLVANTFDERDVAVKKMLQLAITACKKHKKYIGICGQGPSDHPDLAEWLLEQGIESISLNPDTVVDTWLLLSKNQSGNKKSAAK